MTLTRERFLQLTAATLLAPRTRRQRVIVVGAGLAGLTAAYELRHEGFDVLVLEARGRVGGRVWTIRSPFTGGQHAEAGGEYVDTNDRNVLAYLRRFGLETEDVRIGPDLDDVAYYNGRRQTLDAFFSESVRDDADRFWDAADDLDPEPSLDRRSVGSLIDEVGLSPRARLSVTNYIRDGFAVEPRELSLLFEVLDVDPDQDDEGTEAYRVRGGNDQLPRALARELGRAVVLREPVTAVSQSGRGVIVHAGGTAYRGDFCVVAAPLPALRRIKFSPPLPGAVARAVAELRYGVGTKTMLQYRRRIWREQGFNGDTSTDLGLNTAWEPTDRQPGASGILLAYTVGANGRLASRLSADARLREAAAELGRIYPGSRRAVTGGFTHSWSNDPWAGGTWAAFAPGQWTAYWAALRQPVGRVLLAGEHTDRETGYMESAIRSGKRVARAIALA